MLYEVNNVSDKMSGDSNDISRLHKNGSECKTNFVYY